MDYIDVIENGAVLTGTTTDLIVDLDKQEKAIKKAKEEVWNALKEEMEKKGIKKIESEKLLINYIESTDRETFDKKAFQKDHADLYDSYITMKPVKSSIRVKVK
jgi:hypothetical protein